MSNFLILLNNQTLELPEINSKFAHEYFLQIDPSMMHIIKILPTLKAISASCDPILMNLDLF